MLSRAPGLNFSRAIRLAATCLLGVSTLRAAGTAIPHGTVELIAENQWIKAGSTTSLGLRFALEKGWHIYWVNPGDSGEPPRVKWQLSPGLKAGEMEWPAPQRLGTSSVVDFGYEGGATLIVPMHADAGLASEQPAQIAADISVLVCREMCIPGKAKVSLSLPVKPDAPAANSHTAELFSTTRKSMPRRAPANWKFSAADAKDALVLTANLGRQVAQATFYPLAESQIDNAAPQRLQAAPGGFRLTLRKSDQLLKPLDRLKGVLELSPDRAYWIDAPVSKAAAANRDDIRSHPANSSEKGPEQ